MEKLSCILLIDDHEATNFIHQMIIEKSGCVEKIVSVNSGFRALEYLNNLTNQLPNLIFLDINMPKMNGWQFLEAYKKLDPSRKTNIVMLTASNNPSDLEKAMENPEVLDFKNKPLTTEILEELLAVHFS